MSSISHIFFDNVLSNQDKIAIWSESGSLTYKQLGTLVSRWSCAMDRCGVGHGEHVGVLLSNSIEFVALMLVAADLGLMLVPLDVSLPVPGVHRAFLATEVKHVVSTSRIIRVLHKSEKFDFSFVDGLWLSLDEETPGTNVLKNLIKTIPLDIKPLYHGESDDPYILTMTSGSTGDPKPIMLTQQTKIERVGAAVSMYGVTATDRTMAASPLYHSLAERLVLIPLLTGGTSILLARFSPSVWVRCVYEQSVSFTIAVSSQLGQIAKELEAHDEISTNGLRCVVSSSALLNFQVKVALLSKLQCDFHECYGASEIAIASNLHIVAATKKLNTVGRAVPGVEIKILIENDKVAAPGEVGEIACKTPMIFGGYYKRPEQTRDAMWGDYFRTGDLGKLDEDGFLYFMGRKKEVIITGGINVYPPDIESVLSDHPMVKENAAFPFPDDCLGEVVAVAIVPMDPAGFQMRKIRHYCAEQLADYQQPRKLFVVDELPKNEMGKIMKHLLTKNITTQVD